MFECCYVLFCGLVGYCGWCFVVFAVAGLMGDWGLVVCLFDFVRLVGVLFWLRLCCLVVLGFNWLCLSL